MNKLELRMLAKTEGLERLASRLPDGHSQLKFIQSEWHRAASGQRGETHLALRFKEFHLDEAFHILWDVNLKLGDWPVQMDGLLLTERCAIIIESKNISGKIHFDDNTGEFYRFDEDDVKTVLEDPRVQLNKHIRFLAAWFKARKITLPIRGLIVFTAKKCEFIAKPADAPICKTYQLPETLLKIWTASPPKEPDVKLLKIKKTLLSNQTPFRQTPLCKRYFIDPSELKPGVYCQGCQSYAMQRVRRSWQCPRCGERDSSAHVLALREYFTLVSSELTNQEFRRFCGIKSRSVATRLLKELNLETTGELKARVYQLKS
ncbi:nuclease-related domain-containing protein [Planococcus liqunii]|uniref:nuclease-related domain-containing protein n=1 Tax=Planococcus liqunii TaxID=3058394 RepID=UPI00260530C3|nr:nuclease-related domain-containing protein [Planococcus sp. N056]WKA50662.1 nuclease-related domain-containing protein [Planococcus sp. N056]